MTTITVHSGVTSSGIVLNLGEKLKVLAGGTAVSTTVNSHGLVTDFGTTSNTMVNSRGKEVISSGGVALGTVINSGGSQEVGSGGVTRGTVVSGGSEHVFGGVASGTVVGSGGSEQVDLGGVALGTIVSSGGSEWLGGVGRPGGAVASGTVVSSGGREVVALGGLASGTVLKGFQLISGGIASATVVSSGGAELVSSGGLASGSVLSSGALLVVLPGATQSGTVLSGGQIVSTGVVVYQPSSGVTAYGATASNLVVGSGGTEYVLAGGSARAGVVSGGTEKVFSGGAVSGTVLLAGGAQGVDGIARHTIVSSGGFQGIDSGGVASGTLLLDGGSQEVGGVARATVVSSGSIQTIYGGGVASGTVVSAGGFQLVRGGVALDTVVSSGGSRIVAESGVASGTVVGSGGVDYVIGGRAKGTVLNSGGVQFVYAGGVVSGTVVGNGGAELVSSGGLASGVVLSSGGFLVVTPGGTQSGTVVSGGEIVSTGVVAYQPGSGLTVHGATASNVVVGNGGSEYVLSGGSAAASIVSGLQFVYSGAIASGTVVSGVQLIFGGVASDTVASGQQNVQSGVVNGTILLSGGEQNLSGGVARDTVVSSGSFEVIYSGAMASGTIVSSAGTVFDGGLARGTLVSSGGVLQVDSGATARNSLVEGGGIVFDDGLLVFTSAGTATFWGNLSGGGAVTEAGSGILKLRGDTSAFSGTETISRGTLELTSAGAAGQGTIVFAGSSTTLKIDGATMPTNRILGFVASDIINLAGIRFSSGDSVTYSGTTLSIHEGGSVLGNLTLGGAPYASNSFALSRDPATGGIDVSITTVPCFAGGTRILTARGDIRVEALTIGDRVVTLSGVERPIVWIGERRVDCRAHPRPELVWPIRIRPGAFGEGKPARDLLLSPGHSVFCAGALIPAEHLINGATVVQEQREAVHYFHIELDRHDVVLADGLPAESYLDDGNRAAFENGAAEMTLHPDFLPRSWDDACAPRCTEGARLLAARQLLHERALEIGYRIEAKAGLSVFADDIAVLPNAVIGLWDKLVRWKGSLHRFVLPLGTHAVRIVSRSCVPSWLDPASLDRRQLGVRIGAIHLDDRTVPLTSPLLVGGFYPIERLGGARWRWTNGDARLLVPVAPPRPRMLDLFVRDSIRYWQNRPADRQAHVRGADAPRLRLTAEQ